MIPARHVRLVAIPISGCVIFFSGFSLRAQGADEAQPQTSGSQITFRGTDPSLNAAAATGPENGATVGEAQQEMGDLSQQKDTLQSELQYSQSKLEAAQNRLEVESMAGHAEAADRYQQEVNDWQQRVKGLQDQISQVNNEVQGAIQGLQGPATAEDNMILPGDTLEIFVVEDTSFNGRYQVRRGGYIIMPAVGRIPVAGGSLSEGESEVRKALETTQLQHATVMIEKVEGADVATGPVIFLAGEFKNPHPFHIPMGTKPTVVNVILSCGGVTDKADLTRVRVMRVAGNKSVVEEENVQKILEGSGLTSDLTLTEGDVLMIPAGSANMIFVTGRVSRSGSQSLRPGDHLTAYAAILQAGGFARFADLKKVYILRAAPDGTKVRIPVNVVAIQHGHATDIPLQGDDIVIVPEKFFSF